MRKMVISAAFAACAACGGGSSGSSVGSTVNGTVNGQPMTGRDAVSNVLHVGSNSAGLIFVTNAANTCALITARQQPRNAQAFLIEIGTQGPTGAFAPSSPGVYPVFSSAASPSVTGPVAIVLYNSTDAACLPTFGSEGASGNVTLTRVDSNEYAGSFDITFSGTTGHITGSFSTGVCPGLTALLGGTCI